MSHQICLIQSTQQGSSHPTSLKHSHVLNKSSEHQELSSHLKRLVGQTGRRERGTEQSNPLRFEATGLLLSPDMPQDTRHLSSNHPIGYKARAKWQGRHTKLLEEMDLFCSWGISLLAMPVLGFVRRQLTVKVLTIRVLRYYVLNYMSFQH